MMIQIALIGKGGTINFDQIALVKWTESVGVKLVERDLNSMKVEVPHGKTLHYEILQLFPFTSERKRMGIIIRVSSKYR